MSFTKNSIEFLISKFEDDSKNSLQYEYIDLHIKIQNLEEDINKQNIIKSLEPYTERCYDYYTYKGGSMIDSYYGKYDILSSNIIDLIKLLDNIHNSVKNFQYKLIIKYKDKKYPLRIHINRKGKMIVTLKMTKISFL